MREDGVTMSLYTVGGKGLNEYEPDPQPDGLYQFSDPQPDPQPAAAPGPDPTEAANAALQLVANPTALITEAAASPSLPWPIAIIGLCIVGMIWANYLDGGRKK